MAWFSILKSAPSFSAASDNITFSLEANPEFSPIITILPPPERKSRIREISLSFGAIHGKSRIISPIPSISSADKCFSSVSALICAPYPASEKNWTRYSIYGWTSLNKYPLLNLGEKISTSFPSAVVISLSSPEKRASKANSFSASTISCHSLGKPS